MLDSEETGAVKGDVELSKVMKRRWGNIKYLNKMIGETENLAKKTKDEDTEIALLTNKSMLEEKILLLMRYHDDIMDRLDAEEEIMKEIEDHNETCKEIRKSICLIERRLVTEKAKITISEGGDVKKEMYAKLPKLELKKFNGDPLLFRPF